MMMRFIGFLVVALAGLYACQKTTDTLPVETPSEDSTCRIIQMRQGALDIYDSIFNYHYDDKNRLIKIVRESPDDGAESSYHFQYDGLGRVRQILHDAPDFGPLPNTGNLITKANYEYNGSLLSKLHIEDYFIPYV